MFLKKEVVPNWEGIVDSQLISVEELQFIFYIKHIRIHNKKYV